VHVLLAQLEQANQQQVNFEIQDFLVIGIAFIDLLCLFQFYFISSVYFFLFYLFEMFVCFKNVIIIIVVLLLFSF